MIEDSPYTVFGQFEEKLLGRDRLLQQFLADINKPIPSHASIYGPKYSGKTLFKDHLLKHVVELRIDNKKLFSNVIDWDLQEERPNSDHEFYEKLFNKVYEQANKTGDAGVFDSDAIGTTNSDHALVDKLESGLRQMRDMEVRTLVVIDNFHEILEVERLSENFWNKLRTWGGKNKLVTFIFTSTEPLSKLSSAPGSQVSKFWQLFSQATRPLLPFGIKEQEEWFKPWNKYDIAIGEKAKSRLLYWCGGVPILTARVLKEVWESHNKDDNELKDTNIDNAVEVLKNDTTLKTILEKIHNNCALETLNVIYDLNKRNRITNIEEDQKEILIANGFAVEESNKLVKTCQLFFDYAEAHNVSNTLSVPFGTPEAFTENIIRVLEHQLSNTRFDHLQIQLNKVTKLDILIKDLYMRAIKNAVKAPGDALFQMRQIADQMISLIFHFELRYDDASKMFFVPEEISEKVYGGYRQRQKVWGQTHDGREPQKAPWWRFLEKETGFQQEIDRGFKIRNLDLLTGTQDTSNVCATKRVTRATYVALKGVHDMSVYGEHVPPEIERPPMLAVTASMTALTLLGLLADQLVTTDT